MWLLRVCVLCALALTPVLAVRCYVCVSNAFLSPPNMYRKLALNGDRLTSGDAICAYNYTRKNSVECGMDELCLTVNLTKSRGGSKEKFAGMLRDCIKHHQDVKDEHIERSSDECFAKPFGAKGYEYVATFCTCSGEYCNGHPPDPASEQSRHSTHRGRRPSAANLPFSPLATTVILSVMLALP